MKTIIAIAIAAGLLSSTQAGACTLSEKQFTQMTKGILLTAKTKSGRAVLGKLGLDTTKTPNSSVSRKVKLQIDEISHDMLDIAVDYEACVVRVKMQYNIADNCKMTAKIKEIDKQVFCYLE